MVLLEVEDTSDGEDSSPVPAGEADSSGGDAPSPGVETVRIEDVSEARLTAHSMAAAFMHAILMLAYIMLWY